MLDRKSQTITDPDGRAATKQSGARDEDVEERWNVRLPFLHGDLLYRDTHTNQNPGPHIFWDLEVSFPMGKLFSILNFQWQQGTQRSMASASKSKPSR
jgi:hypothetical protein